MALKYNRANINTLKNSNRALIFDELRKQPLSRAQLSSITNLCKSAVTSIVNELISEGQLTETETLSAPLGRHPILLDIVPDYRYAIGILLHRTRLTVIITDLKFNIIAKRSFLTADFTSAEKAIELLCQGAKELLAINEIPLSKIIGIGVSSPGPLDYKKGVIFSPPNFPLFADADVVSMIKKYFDMPVYLENNSVLLAVREFYLGKMKNHKSSIFVTVENGIGSCIMIDGHVFRGFSGLSGELGHISIQHDGEKCSCGNVGCLELYATLDAMKKRYGFENYSEVVDKAYNGDCEAVAILDKQATYLGSALADVVNLLDPDSIFIYGELNYKSKLLFDKISSIINERSYVSRAHIVDVLPARTDLDELSFAVAALLNKYFSFTL